MMKSREPDNAFPKPPSLPGTLNDKVSKMSWSGVQNDEKP